MKDSFTLDEFILYSTGADSNGGHEMFKNRNQIGMNDLPGPDKRIINNIMSYSRALAVLKTKQTGHVNLLLN